MKKTLLFLLFVLLIGFVFADTPTTYIVSNCENSNFNGEYNITGSTFDGRPTYSKNDTYYLWNQSCDAKWSLGDESPSNFPCPSYHSTTESEVPVYNGYVEGGTDVGTGAPSALTITASEAPLPVELRDFVAQTIQQGVLLTWRTESETENSGYIIERKVSGGEWDKLADYITLPSLQGQGTSSKSHEYSYLDKKVFAGNYSYRLSDVDYQGKKIIHNAIDVIVSDNELDSPSTFGLTVAYPNPFNPTLSLEYDIIEGAHTDVAIYNLEGKLISLLENGFKEAGHYDLVWDAANVSSGIYVVKVVSGEKTDLRKVSLLK